MAHRGENQRRPGERDENGHRRLQVERTAPARQQAKPDKNEDLRWRRQRVQKTVDEIPHALDRRMGVGGGREGKQARDEQQQTDQPPRNGAHGYSSPNRKPKPTAATTPPPARTAIRPHGQRASRPNAMPLK